MSNLLLSLMLCTLVLHAQTIYVSVKGHGLWKSMDDYYTWFCVNENLPALDNILCLGVTHYYSGNRLKYDLYAGTSSGLYRTTDGGITWQLIFEQPSIRNVKVDPTDKNTIYAASGKLFRSTDWGATWVDITPPTNTGLCHGPGLDISPDNRNVIYVFGLNNYYSPLPRTMYDLYCSRDKGNHWELISQEVYPFTGGYYIGQLKFDPQTSQRLYFNEIHVIGALFKSENWGVSWNCISGFAISRNFIVDSFHTNILYQGVGVNGVPGNLGVRKSTDYGISWIDVGLHSTDIGSLTQDLVDDLKIYAGGYDSRDGLPEFYVSTNGGGSWISHSLGLPNIINTSVNAISPTVFQKESYLSTSTAFSAKKLAYHIPSNKFYFAYNGHNRIICSKADNLTAQWEKKDCGWGEYPCLSLDVGGLPCTIWQRNVEPTPVMAGGELWFSRFDGTNWTEPYLLGSFIGPFYLDVNLPSFTIDPTTNKGYVVFELRDRYMNGPSSHLYLGWFSINNPLDIQFTELEFAPNPERCEFPSITQSGNYLYIAFQREHTIYRIKWDIVSQQIVDRDPISAAGRFSHHPYCDAQANGTINYVWEDSTTENIDIKWCWETEVLPPSDPVPVVLTPGKSQWPQICKGTTWITWSEFIYPPTDNNWEICYKDLEYEGYNILSQTLGMSKYSHGVVYRSPYWPPPYEPKLTAIWTEGNESPYEIRAKTVSLPEISYFYVDAGKEEPSPWTVQREGYIQFGAEPEKTIDYHSQKLIYHFPNLNPARRYRINLVFYFESQGQDRWKMKIDGDDIFHANIYLNPNEVMTLERWLPTACYKDGEVYLNITKVIGDYAFVAQVFIYEYEREIEQMAKNTQESESSPVNKTSLFITPNPVYSVATITYAHPIDNQAPATIKIYDASGRLVKSFNHLTNTPVDQVIWNGTDENGKSLANGIYFVLLEHGSERLTEKLVLLR